MRVALVLGTSTGGVGRHVTGLAHGLADAGHEVLVAGPAAVLAHFGLGDAVRTLALEVSDRPHPGRDVVAVARLREVADGADVVHAHGLRVGALAVLARRATRHTPLVVTLHNAAPAGRLNGAVYAGLERVVAIGADLVLGVSADLVERARQLGAPRVGLAVVPAPPAGVVRRARQEVRDELGLDGTEGLLVAVARLAPQKDLDLLLDGISRLRDREIPCLAAVAGDGPDRERLQRRIDAERLPVRLLGHRADITDLLAAADAVVSTARWEGQPVALQEALHAGAAIVATDAGGTAAVLGEAAVLVPVGDADALARALHDVLVHGSVRDGLRSHAVERAGELPTEADALEAALAAYASVGATDRAD